ncbi:NAD(P)/FAD-dependent oxidoreductase [Sorangium sp. So ce388]|uniref:NAD(P)/FAD-dependent oxidoreductase n=1 Tax=Sorangium sp. So ce388 TaxID=3133309 RepID=UPI003F5C0FF9
MLQSMYDVLIVGGGHAGLSAALTLGGARKKVLLVDGGPGRNQAAHAVHNFLSRDGTPPSVLRKIGREQLEPYQTVTYTEGRVSELVRRDNQFWARLEDGKEILSLVVLLAVGMVDEPPRIDGFERFWGKTVFGCPYCHAWEFRDRPIAVIDSGPKGLGACRILKNWSSDVTLFTDGATDLDPEALDRLEKAGGAVIINKRVRRFVGDTALSAIELEDGEQIPREAVLMFPKQHQTPLVQQLSLDFTEDGFVRVNEQRETSQRNIFAAGDLTSPSQLAIIAAAEGTNAAIQIVYRLTP